MDLRNPHLKKAHQVGLFKVGVPEGYLSICILYTIHMHRMKVKTKNILRVQNLKCIYISDNLVVGGRSNDTRGGRIDLMHSRAEPLIEGSHLNFYCQIVVYSIFII